MTELSQEVRGRIIELQVLSLSPAGIGETPGIPPSTVSNTISRFMATGSTASRPRSGRPRKGRTDAAGQDKPSREDNDVRGNDSDGDSDMGTNANGGARVSLIWSQELQDAANELPANIGRSSVAHSLISAFDLLDANEQTVSRDDSGRGKHGYRRAAVIAPDVTLGTAEALKRYHDDRYVGFLLKDRSGEGPEAGRHHNEANTSSSGSQSSDDEDENRDHRPRKRRKQEHGLEHDCPPFSQLSTYASLVAAGTQTAARQVATGQADFAVFWDGGRHHAMRNKASGFCYVADVVFGIMLLTKEGKPKELQAKASTDHGRSADENKAEAVAGNEQDEEGTPPYQGAQPRIRSRKPRVMYIDLDLHYGDGVAQAFLSPARYPAAAAATEARPARKPPRPPQVLTLSVHHSAPIFFPPPTPLSLLPPKNTPHPFTLSIPLCAYPSNATYASIWSSVERVREAFDPDYVVLQLGADGLPGDPIGQYGNWTTDGEGGMLWCVRKIQDWGVSAVVLGGGGYHHPNTARAWTRVTAQLLGRDILARDDVPHHDHFPEYAPSFTMGVESGPQRDENMPDALRDIEETFETIADRIADIIAAHP